MWRVHRQMIIARLKESLGKQDQLRPFDTATMKRRRERMVERQLPRSGVHDLGVLSAMRQVLRHEFVPTNLRRRAYSDRPLPIGEGQTISQPAIVGLMIQEISLSKSDRVLEVGTGSGYSAAILAEIVDHITTVERLSRLAERASSTLQRLGYSNIAVICADGSTGWPDGQPYDVIVVTACGPDVPASLMQQLAIGGRLVMPVENSYFDQRLVRIIRRGENEFDRQDICGVRFVPLIGREGWPAQLRRGRC